MMLTAEVKIYSVTFCRYTNCMHNCVSNNDHTEYLNLPDDHKFLIREDEIETYKNYGGGIKDLQLVGYMLNNSIIAIFKEE